jgi:CelD/BcsL family acetyltransferase involved in cellulose biosynthesis
VNVAVASPSSCAAGPSLACHVLTDFAEVEKLRNAWAELLTRSARPEIVQTPDWLLTWYNVFGSHDGRQLRFGVFREGERLIGLAPLLARRHWYRPGLPFRRLEFLATGERPADAICSEYVNVIAERGKEAAVVNSLAAALNSGEFGQWDEIVLSMMNGETPQPFLLTAAFQRQGLRSTLVTTGHTAYIPLPATWEAYLAALSKNNRTMVRDSVRRFEKWAGLDGRLHRATTQDEMEAGKRILIALHHQRWHGVEQTGVFRSPRFLRFHDEILPVLLRLGAVDLMHLSGPGGGPIAATYNLVWNGQVSFYQSGRKLDVPKNIRPGIVIHASAIRSAIEQGRREYDFLGGAEHYKTQLALASRPIVQVRAVKPCLLETLHRGVEWGMDRTRCFRHNLRDALRRKWQESPAPSGAEGRTGGE